MSIIEWKYVYHQPALELSRDILTDSILPHANFNTCTSVFLLYAHHFKHYQVMKYWNIKTLHQLRIEYGIVSIVDESDMQTLECDLTFERYHIIIATQW